MNVRVSIPSDSMDFNDEGIAAGEKAEVSMSLPIYIAADNYRFSRLWIVLIIYDACLHSSCFWNRYLRRTCGHVAKAPRDAVFVVVTVILRLLCFIDLRFDYCPTTVTVAILRLEIIA